MNRRLLLVITIFITLINITSCVTTQAPIEEFTLADAAIKAAKSVQAVRYSSGYWHQAEEFYRQARILYREREYEQAKDYLFRLV